MAVTIVKKPQGHKIIDQPVAADISDASGDALVTFHYHSLTTGDTVYITSDIEDYNGFWYVTVITPNTFKISEYSGADFVEYAQDAEIDYYQTQPHEWSSVYLPIVYKISNDRWPINSIEAAVDITSFSDDNGYTLIGTSGTIYSGLKAFHYVKITGANEDANGVWQVVETTGGVTIDLPYDSTNSLVSASVKMYWNNYQVKIKIYAGIPAGHVWQSKKPFVEVGELSLTPDENNIVMFSVSDYVRSKVQIKNNLTLNTLPNNIDFWAAFFISVTETFDDSDNYTITTNEDEPYADDDFVGYAIAGELPFKNVYSGYYSDYVYTDGQPAKWLTNHLVLLAVIGRYFDISFILNVNVGATPGFTPEAWPDLAVWGAWVDDANSNWGYDPVNPVLTINAAHPSGTTDLWFSTVQVNYEQGQTYHYRVTVEFSIASGTADVQVELVLSESASVLTISDTESSPTRTVNSGTPETVIFDWTFVPTDDLQRYVSIRANVISDAGGIMTMTVISKEDLTESVPGSTGGLQVYMDGDLSSTIQSPGIGVIRVPFEFATAGRHCVKVVSPANAGTPAEETSVDDFPNLALFGQTGSGASWILGSAPTVTNPGAGFPGVSSKILNVDYAFINGYTYKITTNYTKTYNSGSDNPRVLSISSRNSSNVVIDSLNHATFVSPGGTESFDFTFVATASTSKLALFTSDGSNIDLTINSIAVTKTNPEIPATDAFDLTEEICVDVTNECDIVNGLTPEDIRLLEDGDYRLLE